MHSLNVVHNCGMELEAKVVLLDGLRISIERYSTGFEYKIDYTAVRGVRILSGIAELAKISVESPPSEAAVCLVIDIEDQRLEWENDLPNVIMDLSKSNKCTCELHIFTAAEVGYEKVWNTLSSLNMGQAFSVEQLRAVDGRGAITDGRTAREWNIVVSCGSPASTFDDLFRLREKISRICFLPSADVRDPDTALYMIRNGAAHRLLGSVETEWLDVKSVAYELKNLPAEVWKTELAQAVAQFANSALGGILVLGIRTKRIAGVDTLYRMTPLPVGPGRVQSYTDIIRNKIYPNVEGLEIGRVKEDGGEVVYIYTPPQLEEKKPYLVSGSIVEGRYQRAGIIFIRRSGDASIPITPQEVHALLTAGRTVMRSGIISRSDIRKPASD